MMNRSNYTNAYHGSRDRSQGVALVTALLFLLVVTVLAVTAANNSSLGLKMSANMQDSYRSFQAAEAGAYAVLGLVDTAQDAFIRQNRIDDPFASVATHPLRNLAADPNNAGVDVAVALVAADRQCPRPPSNSGGSSGGGGGIYACDFYRIESEHDAPGQARTKVELGVIKTIIGSQ